MHEKEIVVGTHVDLSGPLAAVGVAVKSGLTLAFEETNKKGGVLGRNLTLVAEDNAYDTKRAERVVNAMLSRGVFAILCATGTPAVAATMPTVLNKGILHLFPFTSADDIYVPSQPLEFTVDMPVAAQIRFGLDWILRERGDLKVGVLARDDAFGRGALDGVNAALSERKQRIVQSATYEPGARSFAAQIAALRKSGVEIVVLGAVAQETFDIARQAHARGWFPVFLCPSACYVPEVATLGGVAVSGLYAVATTPNPYPDDRDLKLRAWVKRYERRFHTVASAQALRAYLNARLFVEALRRSGPNPTQSGFARALEAMPPWRDPDFDALPVDFSPRDHIGLHTAFLAQIRSGRWLSLEAPSRQR
ncbi:MAG: ABC transporter substrate-binding protein [Proteobacteria bacterium]|nr:ABC transporter substrate-binding protein [Pseudomonadota bacterium]